MTAGTETRVIRSPAKGCQGPSEAGRGQKEILPPTEPPEGTSLADTLILAPLGLFQIFGLQNYKRINLCCFKPLCLW